MMTFLWIAIGVVVLGLAALGIRLWLRHHKFNKRVQAFLTETILPLPIGEMTITRWWYMRDYWRGPLRRYEYKDTIVPSPDVVRKAAKAYLKALDNGKARPQTFGWQAQLVVYVQDTVGGLYHL